MDAVSGPWCAMKTTGRAKISLMCLALILSAAGCSRPGPDPEQLLRSLRPQGFVSDYAGVLPAGTRMDLENRLRDLERATAAEIAVVVLPSIGGADINDFASRLFERWGIGKKSHDNGVLFLVALKERKVRIEVGYGLEPLITDATAGQILDKYVVPRFRQGDLAGGIVNGTLALAKLIGGSTAGAESSGVHNRDRGPDVVGLVWMLLIMVLAIGLLIRHPILGYFLLSGIGGPGGFGGGFGGFGGGASGGGGAGRGW